LGMETGHRDDCKRTRLGMTVLELVIAMAVMTLVLGAVLPLFAGIRNGSDTRWAHSEMIQNARVLNDHLSRHLAAGKRIVSVSQDSETDGYIELEAADGTLYRYGVGADDTIEFGPVGDLSALAGPVSSLRFVCYDANDLTSPTDVVGSIRLVTWEVIFRSSGRLTQDKRVTGACYLRANGNVIITAGVESGTIVP
jgi:type II secretory pathway pseudopilin PulG